MKKTQWILITTLLILLTLFSTAGAVPPIPSSFWGSVKMNGVNLPAGTILKAAINGEEYASAIVGILGGESVYSLDVPGDEAATAGVIEGGTAGQTINFIWESTAANETSAWASGTNVNLDLSFTLTAPPVMPASFYGTVKINGENAPIGTLIKAVINGVTYATCEVVLHAGEAVYSLNVPGDDPGTPGVLEGGVEGDSVQFFIESRQADQTGIWSSETNTEINLTGTAPKIENLYHFPIFYK